MLDLGGFRAGGDPGGEGERFVAVLDGGDLGVQAGGGVLLFHDLTLGDEDDEGAVRLGDEVGEA